MGGRGGELKNIDMPSVISGIRSRNNYLNFFSHNLIYVIFSLSYYTKCFVIEF